MTNTITAAGLPSAASLAAQGAVTGLVTTDSDGNLASDGGALQTQVNTNTAGVATNATGVAANTAAAATNATGVATNATGVSTNASAISASNTAILLNTAGVSQNTAGIARNLALILGNTAWATPPAIHQLVLSLVFLAALIRPACDYVLVARTLFLLIGFNVLPPP